MPCNVMFIYHTNGCVMLCNAMCNYHLDFPPLSSRSLPSSFWSSATSASYPYHQYLSSSHSHPSSYFNKDLAAAAASLGYGGHQLADHPYPSLLHPHLQASARLGALQGTRSDEFSSWRYPSLAAAAAAAAHSADYPYHSSLGASTSAMFGSHAYGAMLPSAASRLQASSSSVVGPCDLVNKHTDAWTAAAAATYNERLNSAFSVQHHSIHPIAGNY